MASVRISELPEATVVTGNDTIVIVDSTNTTKKASLSATRYFLTNGITLTIPSSLSATLNGSPVTTISGSVTVTGPHTAHIKIAPNGELVLTNNTSNGVAISFPHNIAGVDGGTLIIYGPMVSGITGGAINSGLLVYKISVSAIDMIIVGLSSGSNVNRPAYVPANSSATFGAFQLEFDITFSGTIA